MVKIGTHSGPFHADEALAVYMLKLLPRFKTATVVRSRDYTILDECDIVVDVRAKYEPPKYFDHHQREFQTTFDPEHTVTKLSSAGLVYKHFGREILREIFQGSSNSEEIVDGIYTKVYDSFIEPVDALDNGVNAYDAEPRYHVQGVSLQTAVSNLAPAWTEDDGPDAFDARFVEASQFMGFAFNACVRSLGLGWLPARGAVEAAYEQRLKYDAKGRLLVLDQYVPWKEHLQELEKREDAHILFVVYPGGDSFRIQTVSKAAGSFESRLPLPQQWRGLRDEELSRVTGVPECVFVHAAGFTGGTKTKEGVLALAAQALEQPYERS